MVPPTVKVYTVVEAGETVMVGVFKLPGIQVYVGLPKVEVAVNVAVPNGQIVLLAVDETGKQEVPAVPEKVMFMVPLILLKLVMHKIKDWPAVTVIAGSKFPALPPAGTVPIPVPPVDVRFQLHATGANVLFWMFAQVLEV